MKAEMAACWYQHTNQFFGEKLNLRNIIFCIFEAEEFKCQQRYKVVRIKEIDIMKEFETNWTKEELKTYLLIYCANADFHESKVEEDYIRSHAIDADFDQLHEEYSGDSDFQRIQKIRLTIKRFNCTKSELDELFSEINNLMSADKSKDILNENFVRELHHILG